MAKNKPTPEVDEDPTPRGRVAAWLAKVQFVTYTTLVLVLLAIGFLWPRMFIGVPPGNRGVMYRYFRGGTVTDRIWGEGLHVIPPWDRLTLYEVRLQQRQLKLDILSEEGLNLGVKVSVRYRPNADMLGYLQQDIGTEYFERLIRPDVEAHVRRTFGRRPAHEIYASAGDLLQELGRIPVLGRLDAVAEGAPRPYVQIQETQLVDIDLPPMVEAAIAERYRQEQLMLEYTYKLDREEKEAERKRTEAAGIRDYNMIAGASISPDLLRWRNIDATLELAKSQNAKVVVLGGGQSVPMILNLDGAPAASAAPVATPSDKAPRPTPAPPVPPPPAPP